MTNEEKVRENRLRRIAKRRGFGLEKSRVRDPLAIGFGLWRISTLEFGRVPNAGRPHPPEEMVPLWQVENFLAHSASLDRR